MTHPHTIRIVDTHTGGEPTRVVVEGGPDLGAGSMLQRRKRFRDQHDRFRSAVVNEPRGSDVMVGALLCEPEDASCVAGVVFFNNVGMLGMCGHGTIGVAVALAHLGRITPGDHFLETPVGRIGFTLHADGHRVTIENVPSYRYATAVDVDVAGHGRISGDIAWGGNWFFLTGDHGQTLQAERTESLTAFAKKIRAALDENQTRGGDQPGHDSMIDHIELFAPSPSPDRDGRNFVLCPGGAWDRSPCGTGTSAKLACLAADGLLQPGQPWRQESVIGSLFVASYRFVDGHRIVPLITGSAWVNGETVVLIQDQDPFGWGIR